MTEELFMQQPLANFWILGCRQKLEISKCVQSTPEHIQFNEIHR